MQNILGNLFTGLLGNLLNWQLVQGYLRNILLGLGASAVTSGLITSSQLNDSVGAVLIVIGVVLSALSNNTKAKSLDVVQAVQDHPAITVVPAQNSPSAKPIIRVQPKTTAEMVSGKPA